jgi:hypothetical protein
MSKTCMTRICNVTKICHSQCWLNVLKTRLSMTFMQHSEVQKNVNPGWINPRWLWSTPRNNEFICYSKRTPPQLNSLKDPKGSLIRGWHQSASTPDMVWAQNPWIQELEAGGSIFFKMTRCRVHLEPCPNENVGPRQFHTTLLKQILVGPGNCTNKVHLSI